MAPRPIRVGARFIGTYPQPRTRFRRPWSGCNDVCRLVELAVAYRHGCCHGRFVFQGGISMRRSMIALLLAACTSAAVAAPTPKDQLLVPPADAAHFVIVSTAGK